MKVAYPELPDEARERLENWQLDKDFTSPIDVILDELHILYRLMRVASEERIGLWIFEDLDQEC